jgi:DNA repair exonuclease SbcCD nuclease subunit
MGHKILMISDIHFGVKNNSEKYLSIIKDFFLDTLKKAIDTRNITDVRILGDLFDCRNNLNVRTFNTVLEIFRWYESNRKDVHFKILLGNHDIYYKNRIDVNSLELLRGLTNITIIDQITKETIAGKKLIMFPWLVEDSTILHEFNAICSGTEKFDLCLGHFEIKGFEISKGQFDDFGLEKGKFKNFKRVFTGHYHLRNTMNQISYLGCPYPITWGDYGDPKGIHIYDIEESKTEFIENTDSPTFIKLTIDDIMKDANIINRVKGNSIKIVIDKKYDEVDVLKSITKIEGLAPIKLDIENEYIEEIDENEDIDIQMTDTLSFLAEYVKNIQLEQDIEEKTLIKHLTELYQTATTEQD